MKRSKANMKKSSMTLMMIGLIIVGIFTFIEKIDTQSINTQEFEKAQVIRTIDGDTIVVTLENNVTKKVRLIGINCPELSDDYGEAAKAYTQEKLTNQTIYMLKDTRETDKYDRLLRYIWVGKPSEKAMVETMFNARLLEEGYAQTMRIEPDSTYSKVFDTLENEAKAQEIGMWKK